VVTVEHLFRNVPVRLKFLRQLRPKRHIHAVVTYYALAYPEVRFHLTADDRTFPIHRNGKLYTC